MITRLAPLALVATLLTGTASAQDVPLDGSSIRLVDRSLPQGVRNDVALVAPDLTGVDPTVTGATATFGQLETGTAVTLDLPASGWSGNPGRGFKFRSRTGPVRSARLVDGRSLRLSASGAGAYALDGSLQGAVGVEVQIGSVRFCGLFGGTIVRDDGSAYVARRAPAPGICAILGSTTTSTSTSSTSTTTTSSTTTTIMTGPRCGVRGSSPGPNSGQYAALFETTRNACQSSCDANAGCQCIVWAGNSMICSLHTKPCSEIITPGTALLYYDKPCPLDG